MANASNLIPGGKRGPSKVGQALKEAILAAAEEHGSDGAGADGLKGYLLRVARTDVRAFTGLLGKVLPLQVAGDPDAPIVHRIERAIVRARAQD